jgi:hypothetical protein
MGATRWAAGCAALVAMSLAACTSNGTKPPSGPPAADSSNAAQPSVTASSVTPGPADAAIKSYVDLLALYQGFARDPVTTDFSQMDPYLTGDAVALFRDSLINLAGKGYAYRGTPPDPQVEVGAIRSPSDVVLTSCPKDSATDPWTEYTKADGQPLASPTASAPLYQKTIYMVESSGSWRISDFRTDGGVTCAD